MTFPKINLWDGIVPRWMKFVAKFAISVASWIGILGLANWVLFVIVLLHWFLVLEKCVIAEPGCDFVLAESDRYGRSLFYGALIISVLLLCSLEYWRRRGEGWRMRYAACALGLTVIGAGYVTAYAWEALNGMGTPSATIRDVGLAIAAVLTLFFVIWRERIASNQSDDKLSALLAERYQNGVRMLVSDTRVERIAGISVIRELGRESSSPGRRNREYHSMSLSLLREWADYRCAMGFQETEDREVQEAIRYLENRSP